jgi:hypothetical protein
MDNGDSFKKVRSGEPMVIPATFYNALVDALAWVSQQRKMQASGRDVIDQRCVLVRNDSGTNLASQMVMGITGSVFDPAAGGANALASFKNDPVLTADVPSVADHTGKFVVLATPVNDGEIAMAYASGTCAVKVHITNATHQFADVSDGNVSYLESGTTGAAAILWKAAATGTVWCVIRFGGAGGGQQPSSSGGFVAKVISSVGGARYTVREQAFVSGGYHDKSGASDVSADNLAELTLGSGAAVDAGTFVLVTGIPDGDNPSALHYVFDHPLYAKYLA